MSTYISVGPTAMASSTAERPPRIDAKTEVDRKAKWVDGFGILYFRNPGPSVLLFCFCSTKVYPRAFLTICDWGDTSAISSTTRVLSRSPPCLARPTHCRRNISKEVWNASEEGRMWYALVQDQRDHGVPFGEVLRHRSVCSCH
jgi:hypothetical protein